MKKTIIILFLITLFGCKKSDHSLYTVTVSFNISQSTNGNQKIVTGKYWTDQKTSHAFSGNGGVTVKKDFTIKNGDKFYYKIEAEECRCGILISTSDYNYSMSKSEPNLVVWENKFDW